MKFTKKIPYALKCAVPTAMMAAATMFGGCQKEERNPKHDVELKFGGYYLVEITPENIESKLADPTVNNIYLRAMDDGSLWYKQDNGEWMIPVAVRDVLEPRINLAPDRIFGRGNLTFEIGTYTKSDSLWFVQHGWTINRQNQIPQKQR